MSRLPDRVTEVAGRARGRVARAARRRVATVREREARRHRAAQAAELAFGGGYLVHEAGVPPPAEVNGWPTVAVGDRTVHTRLPLTLSPVTSGGSVAVLGHPVDVDRDTADPQAITDHLAALAGTAGGGAAGDTAVLRAAAYLGGRWTLLLHGADGGLTVLPDALASRPVWHTPDGRLLASHEALVPGGRLLPPAATLRVAADGAVTVDDGQAWSPSGPTATEDAYREFRERLVTHTRLLAGLGRPAVALTAGPRSRAVLAAYLPHRRDDGFAFTHFATTSARHGQAQADDLFAASALAHRLRVPHRVLPTQQAPSGDAFGAAYRTTYPQGATPGRAYARHLLPPDSVELHSAGAEVAEQAWTGLDPSVTEGDLGHLVMLPFNDRRLLELMTGASGDEPAGGSFVRRLAAELD